ncbi:MAG: CHAT domain-containing protein [Flavobacteriales bacterium]|nr:CHAT domain-containing protein [Flavobacteriales bacterium]
MRIFFLLLGIFLVSKSYALDTKKDSLYFEVIRNDALTLKNNRDLIGSIEKIEFAIVELKLAKLSEFFINKRFRVFLSNRYSNIGDFDRAIELTKSIESFYKQIGDLNNELLAKNNLGIYHLNIGRPTIAYNYFSDCWKMQIPNVEVYKKLDWLDGLAACCIKLGRFKEAEIYLKEAESLLNIYMSEDKGVLLLYHYVNKSNYALAIADDVQAEKFLLKCVKLTEELDIRKGADAFNLLTRLSLKQGKNQQALDYTASTIELLSDDKNPNVKDPYLLQSYLLQAKVHLALNNYEAAVLSCQKAEDQANFFQRQYLFNESKLYIGELRRENLETAVMALYQQYKKYGKLEYIEQALVYVNRAKSNVLNERWANSKLLSLDKRKVAKRLRFKLIFQINKLKNEQGNSEVIELRNKLDSMNKVLGVKEQTPFLVNDLKRFQNSLKKERICLEYMMIDTLLFRFDIQKDKIGWSAEVVKNSKGISDFYDILRNPSSTSQEFIVASRKLPVLLPFQLLKDSTIKEISVIPDGMLNYIIFDALPSNIESGGWKNIRYLAEDYNFSYQFSIQSSENQDEFRAMNSYVGFAPDYSGSKKWATLKNSKQALEQAQDYFGGLSHFGIEASKKKLQELSLDADILHLYAHGVSNDSSYDASYLVLQDGKMQVDEVLALPLKARLCFLTACEVGLGKEYKGEGITSIAWAFKAAGAENVIQSMWKLNEQSSHQLMSYFFDHLAKEINSSEALTKAKRQYLKSSDISERLKHPYYWAGIGRYGKGAVFTERTQDRWQIALGIIVALGFSLVYWKYTTKKRNT